MGEPQDMTAVAAVLDDISRHAPPRGRFLFGITGAPGVGKSTVAEEVVRACAAQGRAAAVLPMDGFHLSNERLRELGRAARKGAPDTFDADGFVAVLVRLRAARPGTVFAPRFHREIEESIAAEIAIGPDVDLVVVEGNYLLLAEGAWTAVRPALDRCVHLRCADDAVRVHRLVARHVAHGRSPAAAVDWVERSDEANARVIEASASRADRIVSIT